MIGTVREPGHQRANVVEPIVTRTTTLDVRRRIGKHSGNISGASHHPTSIVNTVHAAPAQLGVGRVRIGTGRKIIEHGSNLRQRSFGARRTTGDVTWRRDHGMADNMLEHFLTRGWLRRHPHTPRALQLGTAGRRVFTDQLMIEVP